MLHTTNSRMQAAHLEGEHSLLVCVIKPQPQHHEAAVQLLVGAIKEIVLLQQPNNKTGAATMLTHATTAHMAAQPENPGMLAASYLGLLALLQGKGFV